MSSPSPVNSRGAPSSSRVGWFPAARIGSTLVPWALIAAVSGCGSGDAEVVQYQVKKRPKLEAPAAAQNAPNMQPKRIVGGMLAHKDRLWFFKVDGSPERVAPVAEAVKSFVQSITFSAVGEPQWKLPENWVETPGNEFRLATLKVPTEGGTVDLAVSSLPKSTDAWLMPNVNRWRDQASLPPLTEETLPNFTETISTEFGPLTWIDVIGQGTAGGMRPPFAGGGGPAVPSRTTDSPPPGNRPSPSGLTFDMPDGWKPGKMSSMRKASFVAGTGEKTVEISVIDLPRAANPHLENLKRWRGQVQLPDAPDAELAAQFQPIAAGDVKGDYVELFGQNDAGQPIGILGAMIDHREKTWFVKLMGDADVARAQQPLFAAFVKSLQLP